jgi:glutamate-1-semialdehyde 2,1-aminomutase
MYPALQKELDTFERRTPKSAEAHKKNLKRLPLGVASNYRAYDPYPIFVSEASGSKFRDLDGNEYLDHNLCFGTLMAGHSHPAVIKAVEGRLHKGTAYGMPHNMEWELAEEICTRFPVEMCRFGNSGTEATMHTIRLARAATGRDKIIKFEGGYHGLHDAALVSVKPHPPADDFGDIKNPKPVSGGAGVPKASIANVAVATFNDLETVERRFRENPNEIAAVILEPIMMNVGLCMPQKGFLEGLRTLCDKHGALLIFDEVKTGAKLCWGGASEYFGVATRHDLPGEVDRRWISAGGFGAHKRVMGLISDHKVFHGGTYNTNPISMAAGLATFREVLTRANYTLIEKLSNRLVEGYKKTVAKVGLQGYIVSAGANGALMLYPKEIPKLSRLAGD